MRQLTVPELYREIDPARFECESTADLEPFEAVLGQPRAMAATEVGIGIDRQGFNLFALGPPGTGKHSLLRQLLEDRAQERPVPPDWCYVHNFEETYKPRVLRLPAGRGRQLRRDLDELVEQLQTALPAAFENEEYHTRRQMIDQELKEKQETVFEELQQAAQRQGVTVIQTPAGMVFAPLKEGKVLSPEAFRELPEEERRQLDEAVQALQEDLVRMMRQVPRWQRRRWEKIRELNREVARYAASHLLGELAKTYEDCPEVAGYLAAVEEEVVERARDFFDGDDEGSERHQMLPDLPGRGGDHLRRFRINLLVDRSEERGAPVIYEDHPTYQNLIGRVEHISIAGALVTDFHLIKAGALLRANGGYLLLDAVKVLAQPFAWEGLKRALTAGELKIESPGQAYSLISTLSLEPEAVPLTVKVVLVGDRLLYYLLSAFDPDFSGLFKIAADFEEVLDRSAENLDLYARFLARLVAKEELKPLDRGGIARTLEHCSRMVGDRDRLSLRIREVLDLLTEADYWAGEAGREQVTAEDVERAIEAQIYRSDRFRERLQDEIRRGTILVSTGGEAVGQINGLSVLFLGGFSFGRPSRITARVRLGRGELVDIEREAKLAGPIHSKGVLILTGFLGQRYAADRPLALAATLVFEQSYGGVEGDSASLAELIALLSAIAQVPIRQALAVTGSVNQRGEVQAIGGVNEKIEGFFDVCRLQGLDGDQGVLIPAANAQHLMLRRDVVEAVAEGRFHVWTVARVDEAVELLTGMTAGERDGEGHFPEGSFNRRVEARLADLAARARAYAQPDKEGGGEGGEGL